MKAEMLDHAAGLITAAKIIEEDGHSTSKDTAIRACYEAAATLLSEYNMYRYSGFRTTPAITTRMTKIRAFEDGVEPEHLKSGGWTSGD